jgi:hypothetical protein
MSHLVGTKGLRDRGSRSQGKLGILFLHHTHNQVTQHNLRTIRRHNPQATLATMGSDQPLPGGYTLNDTPELKRLHLQMPKRRVDLLVCSWFVQKREKCDRWWIAEWDVYCEMPVFEYYQPVWDFPFVASSLRLSYREPRWNWFGVTQGTPDEYRPYLIGAVPFIYLISEAALGATCRMLMRCRFFSGNSEMRFATAANRSGYPPCGFSPPNDKITWIEWKRVAGLPTIFHPVKHIVDYR